MVILSFHDCLFDAVFFFLLSFGASQEAIFVIVKARFVPFLFFSLLPFGTSQEGIFFSFYCVKQSLF
jgi:hypothetical protein